MKIYIDDVRRCGHCPSGIRRWFNSYGLNFKDFMQNGIDEELFLATGDAYAIRIVQLKRELEGNGR